ncbi:MAG: hypothetical protein BWY09_00509 [Candidatus Hydrogenedentes bacterium ADurb.Bin179]|nr:MAG: hypothetical protein BWY09_00509 [Candidatus Hydrogenedentes bacterium ADurb.Bin179]
MRKMRPSTEDRARQAAMLNFGGVPRKEIAEQLGVSMIYVRRLLLTPPAKAVTAELRNDLAQEVLRWRVERLGGMPAHLERRILTDPFINRTQEFMAKLKNRR